MNEIRVGQWRELALPHTRIPDAVTQILVIAEAPQGMYTVAWEGDHRLAVNYATIPADLIGGLSSDAELGRFWDDTLDSSLLGEDARQSADDAQAVAHAREVFRSALRKYRGRTEIFAPRLGQEWLYNCFIPSGVNVYDAKGFQWTSDTLHAAAGKFGEDAVDSLGPFVERISS